MFEPYGLKIIGQMIALVSIWGLGLYASEEAVLVFSRSGKVEQGEEVTTNDDTFAVGGFGKRC